MIASIYRRIVVITLIIGFLLPHLYASSSGTSIFNFLKIGPGARIAGMGESDCVISVQSILRNPSVIPWIRADELSLQHLAYPANTGYTMVALSHPIDKYSAIGGSLGFLGVGGLTRTEADGSALGYAEKGSFAYSDAVFSLAYGERITRDFSYGASIQAVRETIDTHSSAGVMLAVSGFYDLRENDYQLQFGVFNVGPQVEDYDLPAGGFLGLSKVIQKKLLWTGEAVGYVDQSMDFRTGIEYAVTDAFFLRGGYRYPLNDPKLGEVPYVDLSAGVGFIIQGVNFDYAWVPYGDLGNAHRLTVTLRWGELRSTKRM